MPLNFLTSTLPGNGFGDLNPNDVEHAGGEEILPKCAFFLSRTLRIFHAKTVVVDIDYNLQAGGSNFSEVCVFSLENFAYLSCKQYSTKQ